MKKVYPKKQKSQCGVCDLYKTTNTCYVPAVCTSDHTELLICGEAPSRTEDIKGLPFVGQSGKLLKDIIYSVGDETGISYTNVVKCRPTNESGYNRTPEEEEIACCLPYLFKDIDTLRPNTILALGKIALYNLTGVEGSIHKTRGKSYYIKIKGI